MLGSPLERVLGLTSRGRCWGITAWHLPAGVLILLAVHEGAGLQLAAHHGGAVKAHGRVASGALCLGVAVDPGDWQERIKARQKARQKVRQIGGWILASHRMNSSSDRQDMKVKVKS